MFLKIAPFPSHFSNSSLYRFIKATVSQLKTPFSGIIFFKFGTTIRHFVAYLSQKFRDVQAESKGVMDQDTQLCVSGQESRGYTSVIFTGTANSPFSTPHISITTGPISIKFTYSLPTINTTLHTIFKSNQLSSLGDICS